MDGGWPTLCYFLGFKLNGWVGQVDGMADVVLLLGFQVEWVGGGEWMGMADIVLLFGFQDEWVGGDNGWGGGLCVTF